MSPSDSGDPARIPGREGLLAIRKRADEATPGPWAWEATGEKSNDYAIGQAYAPDGTPISGRFTSSDDPDSGVWMEDAIVRRHLVGEGENGRLADAEFIAHAREDIPFLLQRIDELEAALSAPALSGAQEPPAWMPSGAELLKHIELYRELKRAVAALDPAAADDQPQSEWTAAKWAVFNAAVRLVKETEDDKAARSPSSDAIPVKAEAVPAPQQAVDSDEALKQLRWEALAARSAADFAQRYAASCCRHTEAVSECPHCNLNFLADYARRASAALADDKRSAPRREVLAEFRQRIAAQPHYAPCPHNWAQPDRSQHCLCWMAPALDFLDAELSLGSAAGGHAPQPAPRREDGLSLSIADDPLAISALLDDGRREREMYHGIIARIRQLCPDWRDVLLMDLPDAVAAKLQLLGTSPEGQTPPQET